MNHHVSDKLRIRKLNMKVKCLKIYNESKGKFVESSLWLTINKEYIVLQILCCTDKGVSYRLIGDSDDGSPGVFSANQFEIINSKKASNWDINIKTNGFIVIGPIAWCDNGFWEKCYDGDPATLEIYKREARIIMEEEK